MIYLNNKEIADLSGFKAPLWISPEQYLNDFNIYNPFCLSFEGLEIEHLRILLGLFLEMIPDFNERKEITDAFNLAEEIHSRQVRDNQDPYLMHALKVPILALILNEKFKLGFSKTFLIKLGLLHDTREDHPEFWAWREFLIKYPKSLPDTRDAFVIDHETVGINEIESISKDQQVWARYFQEINEQKFILPGRLVDGKIVYPTFKEIFKDRRIFKKNIMSIAEDRHLDLNQKRQLRTLRDQFLTKRQHIRDLGYDYLKREFPRTLKMKILGRISVSRGIYNMSKPQNLGLTIVENNHSIKDYYEKELYQTSLSVQFLKISDRFANLYDLRHVENAFNRYLKLIDETKKYILPMIAKGFSREVNLWAKHMLEPNQMNRQAAIGAAKGRKGRSS